MSDKFNPSHHSFENPSLGSHANYETAPSAPPCYEEATAGSDVGGDAGRVEAMNEEMAQRLADVFGQNRGSFVPALPEKMKKRLRALKNLQVKTAHLEARFFKEVHEIECRYNKDYAELNDKRGQIITGAYEPSEEELYPEENTEEVSPELLELVAQDFKEDEPGIPNFWYTIFKNVAMLSDLMQPHDEPIIKHLKDIKVVLTESPMGFKLEFHFEPNEYFSNKVLTKEYEMKCSPDPDDPFSFEGPEIFKCRGSSIDWLEGKNVTLKTVKKRQKHKSRGTVRTVTKTVKTDSFFNFFDPPEVPDDENVDMDEKTQATISTDFELGHYIRERIVPHAVLYFTGEALEEEEYEDEDEASTSESPDAVSPSSAATESESEVGSGNEGKSDRENEAENEGE